MDRKIVFISGCFDIFHYGHLYILREASYLGNYLIVGINSDKSIQKIKGKDRPIFSLLYRRQIISSLSFVNDVIPFDEETSLNLIKKIKPDVLVKGGDYEGKEVVGSDIAKEVKLVQFVDGKSTTKTIAKIQSCEC